MRHRDRGVFLSAEEARPEAAVLESVELGLESDALFVYGSFLLDESNLLLHETLAFGLELRLLLFECGDSLLLQLALELEEVEAFDLGPQTVYLRARRVSLLADLLDLAGALFETRFVVLALLEQALVTLERDRRKTRGSLEGLVSDHLSLEDLLFLGRLGVVRAGGTEHARQLLDLREEQAVPPSGGALGVQSTLSHVAPDRARRPTQDRRRSAEPDALLPGLPLIHTATFYISGQPSAISPAQYCLCRRRRGAVRIDLKLI